MDFLTHKMDSLLNQTYNPSVMHCQHLPLMESFYQPLSIIAAYLVIVKYAGPKFMENRKAFDLKTTIQIYNLFQIILCTYVIAENFLSGFSLSYLYSCVHPDFSPAGNRLSRVVYITYLMKLIELVETIFFVLRKKHNQISTLHVYHHCSTFMIGFTFYKYIGGGSFVFSQVINHTVHVVMYTYYFLSSLGIERLNKAIAPFKKFITRFQLIQFVLILVNCGFLIGYGCMDNITKQVFSFFYMCDIILLIHLFSNFYKKSYTKPSQPKVEDKSN